VIDRPTLVTFRAAGDLWAVDVRDVLEIVPLGPITRVPGTPPRIAGITGWRGRTIPLLSLAAALKRREESPDVRRRVLVLGRPEPFGLLVDRSERIVGPNEWERPAGGEVGDLDPDGLGPAAGLAHTVDGLARILAPDRLVGPTADPGSATDPRLFAEGKRA
jgi:hypothetical protein